MQEPLPSDAHYAALSAAISLASLAAGIISHIKYQHFLITFFFVACAAALAYCSVMQLLCCIKYFLTVRETKNTPPASGQGQNTKASLKKIY